MFKRIRLMKRILVFLLLLLSVITQAQDEPPVTTRSTPPNPASFELQPVLENLRRPLYVTHAADGTGRLFVVEQGGIIYVWDGSTSSIFLDLTNTVSASANRSSYTEQGLLGLAFHPDYAENGLFFVNYTDRAGHTALAKYKVSSDANLADANSAEIIFTQLQPFPNHNGGHMGFGADGYLYVSLGDGGAAGDPLGAGQNTELLLGKILRLDVNVETGYGIPPDNPFADGAGGAPEVWSYGWRNVWRFSFDRATGDLYLGDVGQNQWEEIDFEAAGSTGGLNYGWNALEGTHLYNANEEPQGMVAPIAEYNHSDGSCSVTGGYVYRGAAIEDLQATYLFSDYCSGVIRYAYRDTSGAWQSAVLMQTGMQVSSFGEDEAGELYLVDYGGTVYQFVPAP
jgi:glucose/arabinose dehydrogenase